jgi:hypothetical protein
MGKLHGGRICLPNGNKLLSGHITTAKVEDESLTYVLLVGGLLRSHSRSPNFNNAGRSMKRPEVDSGKK